MKIEICGGLYLWLEKGREKRRKKIENLLTSLCEWYVCFGSFRPCFLL